MFGQTAGQRWQKLNDDHFHRYTAFNTQWPFTIPSLQQGSFSLDGLHAICADNGGPIFLAPIDGDKKTPKDFQNKLRIFTNSGALLRELQWPHTDVIAYGWTYKECIAAITRDGSIFIYNIHGNRIHEAFIDSPDGNNSIAQLDRAQITRYGIAVTYLGFPSKVGFYSFYLDDTLFYPDLPPNQTISTFSQVLPLLSHITNEPAGPNLFTEEEEMVLSDPNDELRYKISPFLAICASNASSQSSPTSAQSTSIFFLTPHNIISYQDIVPSNTITKMCIDHCHHYAGILTENNTVYCISLQTGEIIYQFKCSAKRHPQTMVFCGSSSFYPSKEDGSTPTTPYNNLLLHWNINNQSLFMIIGPNYSEKYGKYKDDSQYFTSYKWGCPVIVYGEHDYTIRVLTENTCELIQCLHPDIVNTLTVNSIHPATQLLSSYLQFKTNHIQSNIILRHLKEKDLLPGAIRTLLSAAKNFLHEPVQNVLLQACSFGRHYVKYDEDDVSPDEFVEVCQSARLLFNIKQQHIGVPLTYTLLKHYYSLEQLIIRITTYHKHELAVKICTMMKIPADTVVKDWCMAKLLMDSNQTQTISVSTGAILPNSDVSMLTFGGPVSSHGQVNDHGLFGGAGGDAALSKLTTKQQLILNLNLKLRLCQIQSFVPISLWAAKYGNPAVSIALAFFEPISVHQVSLFLSLRQYNTALRVAYQTGDYELLITTIYRIFELLENKQSFYKLLHAYPEIEMIWLKYCLCRDYRLFLDYSAIFSSQQGQSSLNISVYKLIFDSCCKLQFAENAKEIVADFKHLASVAKEDRQAQNSGVEGFVSEYNVLYQNQLRYVVDGLLDENVVGMSVVDTIRALFQNGHESRAKLLKDEFKISDTKYAYLTVQVLVQKRDWQTLHSRAVDIVKLINNGFEYIIEQLVDAKAMQQAVKYIELMPKYTQQLEWFCELELYQEAAGVAFKHKDIDALYQIKSMCAHLKNATAAVDRYVQELNRQQ